MSSLLHDIIMIVVVLSVSAFFSGMEIAFVSSNKLRFEMERAHSGLRAKIAARFYENSNSFISTLLVGNNIALVIYGILFARLFNEYVFSQLGIFNEGIILAINTIVSTGIVLVTGEFLPKILFKLNSNRTLLFFAPLAYLFYILLFPIARLTSGVSRLLLRCFGVKISSQSSDQAFTKVDLDYLIQSTIEKTDDESTITDEVKIFQNALEFSDTKVRDCIVPRTEVVAVDSTETLEDIKARFVESGYSKLLVYKEDVDNIIGFIHSSEMFRLTKDDTWQEHIRPVPIVPETMTAQKLMQTLMQQKKSLAVVVDEFGGTSGICTLEDLVEELFGDIEDEHDQHSYVAQQLPSGEYELSARLEVEKVNELFNLNLPESDEYLTVGGLLLHHLQRFPKLNEVVTFGGYEFKIIKNTSTKIELVRLRTKQE